MPRGRPTIKDIAGAAGVSIATVSRALRGLPNVSASTRARVRDTAERLRYEAHPHAARLASGRAQTIGLVAPMFGTWFPSRAMRGIHSVLSTSGYDLLISLMSRLEDRSRFMANATSFRRKVDGIVLIDTFFEPGQHEVRSALDCPIVALGERVHGASSISIDNRSAARAAVEHLIGLGHERIGLVAGLQIGGFPTPVPRLRRLGYEDAMRAAGLRLDERLVAPDEQWSPQGGFNGLQRLLTLADPPTAVFCMSDEMAFGALHAARSAGLAVPESLSIVGFDDHELSGTLGLTTVRQAVDDMGANAARTVLGMIQSGDGASDVTWDVTLMERRTSAPPDRTT